MGKNEGVVLRCTYYLSAIRLVQVKGGCRSQVSSAIIFTVSTNIILLTLQVGYLRMHVSAYEGCKILDSGKLRNPELCNILRRTTRRSRLSDECAGRFTTS